MKVEILSKIKEMIYAINKIKNNKQLIITIDEYDGQILKYMYKEKLSDDVRNDLMQETIDLNRYFYSFLKEMVKYDIKDLVISGHTMFSKYSMFSGIKYN